MNFYEYRFIFIFVPIVLVGAALTRRIAQRWQYLFLILASLTFYWTWNTAAVGLLIGSVCLNFLIGQSLFRYPNRLLLGLAITANLAVLGYYKYLSFFLTNLAVFIKVPEFVTVGLPLGISFFTFQQISYLVDSYRRETAAHDFWSYALFISFFPHLIAGPIVLQSDVLRQLRRKRSLVIGPRHLAIGAALFTIGLAKKLILADTFAIYATELFNRAQHAMLSTPQAWQAAVAYTFQIYFDFSAYSDMAVGLAFCMGLRLPFNFNSPYKSLSVSEFWRRWHMTLSRFLRYYLYYPLGGNRRGNYRTYVNLLIVMVLGGLWHGANWTFILWGGLHGTVLAVNHLWRKQRGTVTEPSWTGQIISWSATFLFLVLAWVPFRAANIHTAFSMWAAMLGLRTAHDGSPISLQFLALAFATLLGCLWLPNSQQIAFGPTSEMIDATRTVRTFRSVLAWRPRPVWGLAFGTIFVATLLWQWQLQTPPEFIYFNF